MTTIIDSKYKNETFNIKSKMDMTGLDEVVKAMVKSGYEGCYYNLERVVTGTRKKKYSVLCLKSKKTGQFRAAI